MRGEIFWAALFAAAIGLGTDCGWTQTKVATVSLKPYGVMTQGELNAQHPILNPPPDRVGWTTSGPEDGIAWRGVGDVAIDAQDRVYVALPIWASGYAPKNAARGTGDKLRVLTLNADSKGGLESNFDFPTKSLNRVDLRLAADGTLMVVAGDRLMRIGKDGKATGHLELPDAEKEYEPWFLTSSTSGKTVRVRVNYKLALFVDTESLRVIRRCDEETDLNDFGSMTDDLELSTASEKAQLGYTHLLQKETFCEKPERMGGGNLEFSPAIVDDSRYLELNGHSIRLKKMSGEPVWETAVPANNSLDGNSVKLSRDGSRVAAVLTREVIHHEPDSMNPIDQRNGTWNRQRKMEVEDMLAVWDVATGRLLGEVPLLGHTEARYFEPNAQYALSPDGRLLGVLEDGELTLWKME